MVNSTGQLTLEAATVKEWFSGSVQTASSRCYTTLMARMVRTQSVHWCRATTVIFMEQHPEVGLQVRGSFSRCVRMETLLFSMTSMVTLTDTSRLPGWYGQRTAICTA